MRKIVSAFTIVAILVGMVPGETTVPAASAANTIYVSSTAPGTLIPGVGYVIKVTGGTLSILWLGSYSDFGTTVGTNIQNCTNSTVAGLSWNIVNTDQINDLWGWNINGMGGATYFLYEQMSSGVRQGYYNAIYYGVASVGPVYSWQTNSYTIRCTASTTDYVVDAAPAVSSVTAASQYVTPSNSGSLSFTLSGITDTDASQTLTYSYQWNGTGSTWTNLVPTESTPKSNTSYVFSVSGTSLPEWSNTLYVRATDSLSASSDIVSATVTKDTVAPTSSSVSVSGGATYISTPSVTLTLSSSGGTSGLGQMQFSCDNATYSVLEAYSTSKSWDLSTGSGCTAGDGTKTVYARFKDNAGNLSAAVSDSIVLDTTAPVITITNPDSTPAQSKTLTATGSDANGYTLTMAVGTSTTCDSSRTFSAYGSSTFSSESDNGKYACYKAVDGIGNVSYLLSSAIAGIDTAAPSISISNPGASAAQSKTITASGSDLNSVTLAMSIGTSTTCNGTRTFGAYSSITFSLESDNGKYVCYSATDSAGNVSYEISSAISGIDTTAPVITVVDPSAAIAPSKSVSASANEGTLSYSVNSSGSSACGSGNSFFAYSGSVSFSNISDNGKSVCFRAIDTAGNVSYELSATLSNVGTVPTISVLRVNGFANPIGITTLYPVFSFSFSDPDAGDYQSAYRFVVTDSGSSTVWDSGKVSSSGSSAGFVWSLLSLDGSSYGVTATAWDSTDFQSSSLTGSFTMLGVPTPPSAFSVTGFTVSGASYSWSDNASAQYQETKHLVRDGSGNVVSDNLAADSVSDSESGLAANTLYARKACASNAAGESCSGIRSFYTLADDPSSVSAVAGYDTTNGQNILLSWNPNGNSATYVYSGATLVYSGSLSSFRVTHLSSDTAYAYVLRSANGDGVVNSTSASVSAVTLPAAPDITGSISQGSLFNSGSVSFSNNATGISSYWYKWDKSSSGSANASDTHWTSLGTPVSVLPSSDGHWYFHVTPANASGALGTPATYGPYSYDSTAPAALTVSRFLQASQSGFYISGTCVYESGASIRVMDGSTQLASIPATSPCTFSYTGGPLSSGTHPISAYMADAAGNRGPAKTLSVENYDAGAIITPVSGSTVTPVFSITGFGKPNSPVSIYSGTGNVIASGSTDGLGHFAVQTVQAHALGSASLDVSVDGTRRNVPIPVTVASSSVHTPSITNISDFSEITTKLPTIMVSGEPLSHVRVYSRDSAGNIVEIGSTPLNASGTGSIVPSSELPVGENIVYVVDDIFGLSSQIRRVVLVDPWGYAYDASTGQKIAGVKVTILDASGSVVPLPSVNGVPQSNPVFTDSVGYYGTYELPGTYRIVAEKSWYSFPSTRVASGSNNLDGTSNIGGHGQLFTISGSVLHIDIPMDPVAPAPAVSSGGGSSGAPLPMQKDKCPNGDLSPSFYDNSCAPTAESGSTSTGEVVDHVLGKLCYGFEANYIDRTNTPGLSDALEKMIRCGIIPDGLVVEGSDPVYRYDVFRMVALAKNIDPTKYEIGTGERSFSDLPKSYTDAKLWYSMRGNGYLPQNSARSGIYSKADAKFVASVLKKAFGYDATKDLKWKRITMKEYLLALYKASEYAKQFDK